MGSKITCPKLKYIDINMLPNIKEEFLDEFRRLNPTLIIRRYMHQEFDPKDNGLRKPLRSLVAKKKKKGKKGKKKKK